MNKKHPQTSESLVTMQIRVSIALPPRCRQTLAFRTKSDCIFHFWLIWNSKRTHPFVFQINRKMVNTIWFLVDLTRFKKVFSVCTSYLRQRISSYIFIFISQLLKNKIEQKTSKGRTRYTSFNCSHPLIPRSPSLSDSCTCVCNRCRNSIYIIYIYIYTYICVPAFICIYINYSWYIHINIDT